jgi:xanthine dehydrogenase accessory factor
MHHADILRLATDLKAEGTPFALATVVRTVSATAAKAGSKAVIRSDGTIAEGWIGGGCARAAVLKAAREAIADGRPRLVSVQPKDLLGEQGVKSGDERDGVRYASNMCPSKGTMDIFVEPVIPRPELVVFGASPVAVALVDLARNFGLSRTVAAPVADHSVFAEAERLVPGYDPGPPSGQRLAVVATQGRGDEEALLAAIRSGAQFVAFVGSRAKGAALTEYLAGAGATADELARLKVPAGLDIGAITPDEIALSILAEIVALRRRAPSAGAV